MAMALWGTVAGSLFGAIPTQRLGRKKTLLWVGVFYTVSALGSALANDPISFAAFRFIGGIGVGVSAIAAPAYISEIAPAKSRGRLVGLYQFSLVLGILIAFISNYLLSDIGENAWRWMMGVEAIPAILYTLLCLGIPKSPRWLITRGELDQARQIHNRVDPEGSFDQLVHEMTQTSKEDQNESIFDKKYRFPLKLAFLVAFFNQLSGINAFLYYAPRIFEEGGLGESTSLLSSVGIGITNLVFTIIGVALIDKTRKKKFNVLRLFWIYYFFELSGLCLFLSVGRLVDSYFSFPFHCGSCHWSGSHYLGLYI